LSDVAQRLGELEAQVVGLRAALGLSLALSALLIVAVLLVLSRLRAVAATLKALAEAHATRETDVADAGAYAREEMARRKAIEERRARRTADLSTH
jgi:hypothetical protein